MLKTDLTNLHLFWSLNMYSFALFAWLFAGPQRCARGFPWLAVEGFAACRNQRRSQQSSPGASAAFPVAAAPPGAVAQGPGAGCRPARKCEGCSCRRPLPAPLRWKTCQPHKRGGKKSSSCTTVPAQPAVPSASEQTKNKLKSSGGGRQSHPPPGIFHSVTKNTKPAVLLSSHVWPEPGLCCRAPGKLHLRF